MVKSPCSFAGNLAAIARAIKRKASAVLHIRLVSGAVVPFTFLCGPILAFQEGEQ